MVSSFSVSVTMEASRSFNNSSSSCSLANWRHYNVTCTVMTMCLVTCCSVGNFGDGVFTASCV